MSLGAREWEKEIDRDFRSEKGRKIACETRERASETERQTELQNNIKYIHKRDNSLFHTHTAHTAPDRHCVRGTGIDASDSITRCDPRQ